MSEKGVEREVEKTSREDKVEKKIRENKGVKRRMQCKQENLMLWDDLEMASILKLDQMLSRSVSLGLAQQMGKNWMLDIQQILLGGVCEAGESLV